MAKKVLVADDDPVIIKLLQVNLELEGYEVITAEDGEEAVKKAGEARPDVIILDIMMPKMDGMAARRALLEIPVVRDTPVIFLSARAQQSDIQKGLEAGVVEYITKPFDPLELVEIIGEVLAGSYRRRSPSRDER